MKIKASTLKIPLNVPDSAREIYLKNYLELTRETGKLFLFAGDQKMEHLNTDFYGPDISLEDSHPDHLFTIAKTAPIGALATQYGLVTQYGMDFPKIPLVIKMNGKTDLVKPAQRDPLSKQFVKFSDVLHLRDRHNLNILGVGYTIYIGSEFESIMIKEAQRLINAAHKNGLITIIWAYPRGKAIKNPYDSHIIAGSAGVAGLLGSDFVKVNMPDNGPSALSEAVAAAGRTKVITAGGNSQPVDSLLKEIANAQQAGSSGSALGRNIHQKDTRHAIALCNAAASIIYLDTSAEEAYKLYLSQV